MAIWKMRLIIIISLVIVLVSGCQKEKSIDVIRTTLTVHERDGSIRINDDSFRYFVRVLENDSGFCINRIFGSIHKKGRIKSLRCADKNNDSTVIGTYRYLPTFLYHQEYCRPHYQRIKEIEDEAWYYKYESKRNYIIGDDNYDINSYYIDAIGSDLSHRLYFSPKLGLVAGFATSWGNKGFYKNEGNLILEELKAKLKSDTNFFPIPVETIIPPPKPE